MIKVLSLVLLVFFSQHIFAVNIGDHVAKVIQISKSGKTIIIDRGDSSSFAKNDFSYLLGAKTIADRLFYYPTVKMKLVKEGQKNSVWLVVEQFKTDVKVGEKYLFFTLSDFLKGRTPIKISRRKIITSKKNQKANLQDSISFDDHKLSKKKDEYTTVPLDLDIQLDTSYDLKLIDIDHAESSLNVKKSKPIYMSPSNEKYADIKSINTFDKMIYAFLKSSNRKTTNNDLRDTLYLSSSQKTYKNEQRRDENFDRISKLFLQNGESWSDDLSDEELSRVLLRFGDLKEKNRRENVSAQQFNGQFFFGISSNLSSSTNTDAEAASGSTLGFNINAELFPLKRFASLSAVTVEFEGAYAQSIIGLEDYNGTTSQISFAGYLNWYPFKNPALLNSSLWFTSFGLKAGFFNLYVKEIEENARYRSLTVPSLRFGLKYNFSQSFGARLYYQVESVSMQYTSGSQNVEPEKSYDDRIAVLSLSKFF